MQDNARTATDIDVSASLRKFSLIDKPPIFAIGTFDAGITVLKQQVRALNLAWTLVESGVLAVGSSRKPVKVAVVGTGFAGLTFAAGLLKKKVSCEITLFEEHDTLLPLQQGSDTRWLHPHIYDWPDEGSEADVAMLPVLNWSAARASDVVVQVLQDWEQTVEAASNLKLFCNTRHLQIAPSRNDPSRARIEWVGEPRAPADGTTLNADGGAKGCAGLFDLVILAVGFGISV